METCVVTDLCYAVMDVSKTELIILYKYCTRQKLFVQTFNCYLRKKNETSVFYFYTI